MAKVPRSVVRLWRTRPNFIRNMQVAGTELNPSNLAGLPADVTTLKGQVQTASTGLIDKTSAAEGRLDAVEGDVTTLEGQVQTTSTGLIDKMSAAEGRLDVVEGDVTSAEGRLDALERVSPVTVEVPIGDDLDTFAFLDTSETYTYSDTPNGSEPTDVDMPSDATEANITLDGSGDQNITFYLPHIESADEKTVPVFKVVYDKGSHTGDFTIAAHTGEASEALTGSGTAYYIWDEATSGWVNSDDDATIQLAACNHALVPEELQPDTGKTLTVSLPTDYVEDFVYVAYDTSDNASGDTVIGDVTVDNGTGAAGVLVFWWDADTEAYVSLTSSDPMYTLPDNCPKFKIDIDDANSDNTFKVCLPTGISNISRALLLDITLTDGSDDATIDIHGPGSADTSAADGDHVYACFGLDGSDDALWYGLSMVGHTH